VSKLLEMLATLRQPTRPCQHRGCKYAARHGRIACGIPGHDPGGSAGAYPPPLRQQQLPDEDSEELKRLAERDRQRRAVAPRTGADPYRTERMVRSAMPAEGTDGPDDVN